MIQVTAVLVEGSSVPGTGGGQGVAVQPSGDMTFNEFMSYMSYYGAKVAGVSIECTSANQLTQPFYLNRKNIDGTSSTDIVPVNINKNSKMLASGKIDFGDFEVSGLNSISYNVLPGENIKIDIGVRGGDVISRFIDLVSTGGLGIDKQKKGKKPSVKTAGKKKPAGKGFRAKKGYIKASYPIIITAYNSSTADAVNVELFNPVTTSQRPVIDEVGSVKLGSGIPNISYKEVIRTMLSRSFIFGMLRIRTDFAPSEMLYSTACDERLIYKTRDVTGRSVTTPIVPNVDKRVKIGYIRDVFTPMLVCNITSMVTTIKAGCRLSYEFYPRNMFDAVVAAGGHEPPTAEMPRFNSRRG